MIVCDVCEQAKECLRKEIDGKEYDICPECWTPWMAKLKGKGRVRKEGEMVFIPPLTTKDPEPEKEKPVPGQPPKIWSNVHRVD